MASVERAPMGTLPQDMDLDKGPGRMLAGILPGGVGFPPKRGTKEFLESYSTFPWFRAVVGRIADAVAATQWQLYVVKPGGGKEKAIIHRGLRRASFARRKSLMDELRDSGDLHEIQEHLFLDLLDSANEYHTGKGVWKVSQISVETVGEFFWLKERNPMGAPVMVWPIPAHWVLSTPTPTRRMFRVSFRGWQGEIPETEMFWGMDLDPAQPYGRGTGMGHAVADELETDKYAALHTKQMFFNRMRPDLLITAKDLTEPETRRLERDWSTKNQGFWRAFKAHFINRDVKVHEFDADHRSAQFVQLRQHERDMILQVWGMPPEIMGVLESSNRACYDSETECLTANGWRRQEDLRDEDEVAVYDPTRHSIRFERPWRIVRYPYQGEMLQFNSYCGPRGPRGNIDICVTPDHRMLVRRSDSPGRWETRHADALGSRPRAWRVVAAAPLDAEHPDPMVFKGYAHRPSLRPDVSVRPNIWAAMLGLLVAEGSWKTYYTSNRGGHASYQVSVSQSLTANPEKVRQIDALVSLFPIKASRYIDRDGIVRWQWNHRSLVDHLTEHCGTSAATKRLPEYIRKWPGWLQRLVIEWAILGDGTSIGRQRASSWQLVSTSPQLMEDYQEVATKGGLRAGKIRRQYAAKGNRRPCYRLGISEHVEPELPVARPVPYDDTVWCLETTTGWFVTRRNGCVAIQGNTIEASDFLFSKHIVVPRLEFWRTQLQERFIGEYDERLILDYVSPVQEDKTHALEAAKAMPAVLMVDEWRAKAGLEPLEGKKGQVFLVPFGIQSTEDFDLEPPPPLPLDTGGPPPGEDEDPEKARPVPWRDALARDAAVFRDAARILGGTAEDLEAERFLLRRALVNTEAGIQAIAAKLEPKMRRVFLAAVQQAKGTIDVEQLAALIQAGTIDQAAAAAGIEALRGALGAPTTDVLQRGFLAGGTFSAEALQAAGLSISFDLTNPRAIAWAGQYSSALVTEIGEATRAGIRTLIEDAFTNGVHPYETAKRIQAWVGLTSRQQSSVASFAQRLLEDGIDPERAEARANRYAQAQLRYRSQTIARTETLASANHGQQELWTQAREAGLLNPSRTRRVWIVTEDDRLDTEICEPMADQKVGLHQPFKTPQGKSVMVPPVHPACRCAVGLEIA